MRRFIAVTAVAALLTGLGVAVATSAGASVTAPGNGTTVRGTITLTESPGGSDTSSIFGFKHCGGNTSTALSLVNSAGTTLWSAANGGGVLSATVRTENYPNGSYSVKGVEKDGANSGFLGCKSNTRNFSNAITISNQKAIAYTGATDAVAGTSATVSAKVTDPNDASAPLNGQTVTFTLSGGAAISATTNASGIASATLAVNTPPRAATLSLSSPATANFTAASKSVSFSVDKIPSTVALSPIATVVHGQQTQFTATVGHNATLAATGSVQFVVDGSNFGAAVPLAGDVAQSATTSSLSTGDHSVVAKYSGDANYVASTSATATQHVAKAATQTTIDTSLNPAVFGQPVTFTAHLSVVAPGVGTPSGAFQFDVDGAPFGTAIAMTGNSASLTIPSLAGGNHDVTATYNGDTDFAASTSADLTQGVDRAATEAVVHSSAEPSVTGQPVTFSVDVSAQPPGTGTPSGQVQFTVDGTNLGGPVTLTGGSATSPSIADLTPGTHVVLADYQGSSNFSGTLGSFFAHVDQAQTSTSIASAPNPSVFGQPITFSSTVAAVAPGSGTPTGFVQFAVDGDPIGSPVALVGGQASSAPVADLGIGGHQISAAYLGDSGFAGSGSASISQTVNKARTSTALTSSANPSVSGQPVTLTATVSATAPGAGNPTGSLVFSDGATVLGTVPVGPETGEQADITVSSLAVGPHAISVTYSGDNNFQSSSDAATQTVHRAQTSTVVVSSVNPAKSGQTVRFTATVSPVAPGAGVATGAVTFTVNGAPIGSPVNLSDGSATSTAFSSLTPGTYDIRASYAGDVDFVGSAAALDEGTGQTVTQAQTSMDLTSTPNPAAFGATVSFTATVSAVAPATGRPTGVVDFYDGVELIGAVSLAAGDPGTAAATFTSSTLATGTHAIRADYLGNFNFVGQTASLSQLVGQVNTVTGLTATPSPAVYGHPVTLTATVATDPAGAGTPTGTVTFLDGTLALGTAALATVDGSQQASITVIADAAGVQHLTARYSGGTRFGPSTSVVVADTVQRAASTLVAAQLNAYDPPNTLNGTVSATLTGVGGAPLAGQELVFTTTRPADHAVFAVCDAVTDANGVGSCDATAQIVQMGIDGSFDVHFLGSVGYLPSQDHRVQL